MQRVVPRLLLNASHNDTARSPFPSAAAFSEATRISFELTRDAKARNALAVFCVTWGWSWSATNNTVTPSYLKALSKYEVWSDRIEPSPRMNSSLMSTRSVAICTPRRVRTQPLLC